MVVVEQEMDEKSEVTDVEYWIEDRARTTHACVEHKLLAEISHLYFCIPSDILYIKSVVGSLGHTMRLNPK
jgi:hypothetical protein